MNPITQMMDLVCRFGQRLLIRLFDAQFEKDSGLLDIFFQPVESIHPLAEQRALL